MTKTTSGLSALALIAALSACDSRTEAPNNVVTTEATTDMADNVASMTPDLANPFAESEGEMITEEINAAAPWLALRHCPPASSPL